MSQMDIGLDGLSSWLKRQYSPKTKDFSGEEDGKNTIQTLS